MENKGAFFSFKERDESGSIIGNKQIPFTVVVLGNFSGKNNESIPDTIYLEYNLDTIFKMLDVKIEVEVENILTGNGSMKTEFAFKHYSEIHPKHYLSNVGSISEYSFFISRLKKLQGEGDIEMSTFSEIEKEFLVALVKGKEEKIEFANKIKIKEYEIGASYAFACKRLNEFINSFIYSKELQNLEFLWKSMANLVSYTKSFSRCKIGILDTSKEALADDLLSQDRIDDTGVFYQIYTKELDQFGGEPVGMLINMFTMDSSYDDSQVLHRLSDLGGVASCMILNGIDSSVFGVEDLSFLENSFDFADLKKSEEFAYLKKLSKSQSSRFISLNATNICIRNPYSNNDLLAIEAIEYEDLPPQEKTHGGLWGNSVMLASYIFIRFFEQHGHCSGSDESSNSIISLKEIGFNVEEMLDWSPDYHTQSALSDFGVMSFKYTDYKLDKIIFSEMNMFNINSIDDYHSSELTSKERVNVRMPQLLFVAQLNHYLRMIRRQSFARDDIRELRRELTDWLKLYISDEYVASDEIKLYKPLKSADVKLSSNASGETTFSLNIVPHSKFRGLEYSISL